MKTTILKLIVLSLMLVTTSALSAQSEPIMTDFVIKGKLYSSEKKKSESRQIFVYKANQLVEVVKVKRSGRFAVKLNPQSYYTLQMRMDGHVDKKVVVSTEGADGDVWEDIFKFDVYLYPKKVFSSLDTDVLDYPTAMIEFDSDDKVLLVNKPYSIGMYHAHRKLIEESKVVYSNNRIE